MVTPGAPGAILALDQGGMGSRAVLFDAQGREIASAHVPVATTRDGADVVEQDPDELVHSLQVAARDVLDSEVPGVVAPVVAGLATQRSTIVCWDRASGRPLTAAISWQDRRNAAWLERLRPFAAGIRSKTGLVLSPHYGASKLRWCLDHDPGVARAARSGELAAGPLSSFLLARLLEERPFVADPSNASRTLLFEPGLLDWSPALLAAFGIDAGHLPRCVPTRHAFGHLAVAERRVPLTACTGDQAAAVFALGRPRETVAFVNVGTGAFVQRPAGPGLRPPDGLLQSVLCSDGSGAATLSHEGTVNGAGSALEWLRPRVALDLDRALASLDAAPPAEVPLFVNGVGGLGAPWWIADFPVEFVGRGDGMGEIAAVVESIVFMLAVNLGRMRAAAALERVVISGGLAGCEYLCRALASVTGLPVERHAIREATARGVAFLAAGEPDDWTVPAVEQAFGPEARLDLGSRYAAWRLAMESRGAVTGD